ncbi:MAG: hypothetical protein PHP02_04775 [Eubacteriales bacterium]|nr:hypothetical protein [Eubacteriales bacterium]
MAKPVTGKKVTVNRKAVSAVTLIVLIALTVAFVWLGMTGMNLDGQGLYKLLPWLPTMGTEAGWQDALVPGAELGETYVMHFTPEAENPLTGEEQAETIRVMSERIGDLGWQGSRVELLDDGTFRATMPMAANDGHIDHLLDAKGEFTFTDPEGNEFLTGANIEAASFGMSDPSGTDFSLSIAFDAEGSRIFGEKTTQLVGQSITLKLDGETLVSPGVNMPLTEGGVSIPGFALEPAREYAIMMRSGPMPYALEVGLAAAGAPTLGEGVTDRLVLALLIVFVLVALFLIIRQRLGGLIAAWMLLLQLALSYFFAALMGTGFTLVTLAGIWLAFLAMVLGVVMLFENVQEDVRRGRSVRQAVKESYGGRGHGALDVMAALIAMSVMIIIVDAQGIIGSFGKVLGVSLLTGLVLSQVALRLILNESLTLFGDRSALYASGVMKKEEA